MRVDDLLAMLAAPEAGRPLAWIDVVLLGAALVTCAFVVVVDARERIIPDLCNGVLAGLGLAFASLDGPTAMLAAALQGGMAFGALWGFRALYRGLRGRQGLGLGDVKFLGAAGTWVGLGGLPPLILVACAAALAFVGLLWLRGRAVTAGLALPFGPFLVAGFLAALGVRVA